MAPTVDVLSNVSNIKQEVEETPRGTKRSYIDYGPYAAKTPKLELEESLASPETFRVSDSSCQSGSEDQSLGNLSAPKEEPEEELAELIEPITYIEPEESSSSSESDASPPIKKRRGRPPGKKNPPKEVQYVRIANKDRIVASGKYRKRNFEQKTAFTYPQIITMSLLNSPEERATCTMMYDFALYHFPKIGVTASWKNTLRHALAPHTGFQKEQLMGRSSFWYIIPERRSELIKAMVETAVEYKEDKDALMMRDVDELPKLLAGKSRLPKEAKIHSGQITELVGPKPASDNEFEMILKKKPMSIKAVDKPSPPVAKPHEQPVVEKSKKLYKIYDKHPVVSTITPGGLPKPKTFHRENHGSPFRYVTPRVPVPPRGYWDHYGHPKSSAAPYYSNPWQPAHQPGFVYGGPQPGYGMPMYGYQQEVEERQRVTPTKPELILIDDEKPVVGSLASSRAQQS